MALATEAPSSAAPPVPMGLRIQLSVMMFLQFAVWGAWFSVLGNRLAAMNLGGSIGSIYATMPLGAIFAPLLVGQLADRYFSSQRMLSVLHLGGAGLLYWLSTIPPVPDATDKAAVAATASLFWWGAFGYALLFNPTLALANSIAFTHLPNGERDFPGVRVLGTIGWIVTGMTVGIGLTAFVPDPKTSNLPLLLAAVLSVVLAIYSLTLPHTPPKGESGDLFPAIRAVGLLRDPSFAVFFGASFLITIVLAFYYNFTGVYLQNKHNVKDVASWMTVGQWSEMLILPFLPFFLRHFGMKWVLAVGMLAWGVRYAIFSLCGLPPTSLPIFALVLVGVALHGVCFDFFFAAGFIHVDKEAPADIRGSGQALFTFLTYGLGMWLGGLLSGYAFGHFTREVDVESQTKSATVVDWYSGTGFKTVEVVTASAGKESVTDWTMFWLVPAVGVLVALAVFVLGFRMRHHKPE
jgi:nucleoside transporter